ncbi:hypothetical protein HB912_04345 [Listeria aquatica]|uniref:Uncharacterized protein n=1 Tax=Listeria aquatica TaxID=1494960 RepID=A0A841ZQG5_9LIST|nr:hypothetical protein [Listeria aquatica]MBC1520881.1 hypothetical protein [Listeria aquatica]
MKNLSRILWTLGFIVIFGTIIYLIFFRDTTSVDFFDNSIFRIGIYGGIGLLVISSIMSFVGTGNMMRIKNGEAALGIIRSLAQTGTYINQQPQVEMQVDVIKKTGESFQSSLKAIIPLTQLSALQIGAPIPVVTNEQQKVALPKAGEPTLTQEEMQELFEEFAVKTGMMDSEALKISKEGITSYATVIGMRPENSMSDAKVNVWLDLEVALKDNTTQPVSIKKTVLQEALDQVQPGKVIEVIYLEHDPEKLVIKTKNVAGAVFGSALGDK